MNLRVSFSSYKNSTKAFGFAVWREQVLNGTQMIRLTRTNKSEQADICAVHLLICFLTLIWNKQFGNFIVL